MKYESLGQTACCWVGQDKQGRHNMEESRERAQSNPRMRPERTHSRGAARSSRSSMYKVYIGTTLQVIKKKKSGILPV